MAKPKAKVIEFPAECCGVCRFCHKDGPEYRCWVEPARADVEATRRGVPTEPLHPVCRDYKHRDHG